MRGNTTETRPMPWGGLFLALGAALGLAYLFLTPAMAGVDEQAHLARVAYISHGVVIAPSEETTRSGNAVDTCLDAYTFGHLANTFGSAHPALRDQFRNPPCRISGQDQAHRARPADVYSPVPYAPALVGYRIGRAIGGAAGSLYVARFVQLAAYLALMTFAIRRAPWGKPLLFTIGLLPVTLQGAANVSADPVTLALTCCTVALVLRATARAGSSTLTTTDWLELGLVVAALALCKSAYVPFALLLLAIPAAAFPGTRRRLAIVGGTLGVAVVLAAAWNLGVVADIAIVGVNGSDSVIAAKWIQRHPTGFLTGVARGWANARERTAVLLGIITPVRRLSTTFPLPAWVGALWLVLVRLADPVPRWLWGPMHRRRADTAGSIGEGDTGVESATSPGVERRALPDRGPLLTPERISVAIATVVGLASVGLIEYGIAIAANPPATREIVWVQGRYFLPLVPLTLFGAAAVGARNVPRRYLTAVPVVSVLLSVAWLWWASSNPWGWI